MPWWISRDLAKSLGLCHPSCALVSCVDAFNNFPQPNPAPHTRPQEAKENTADSILSGLSPLNKQALFCAATRNWLKLMPLVRPVAWHGSAAWVSPGMSRAELSLVTPVKGLPAREHLLFG